ncbi:MAG TPA: hypothetical protein VNP92_33840 [Actinophytocola sp.]|nr:hypothetical protein [Actinophytocola sp.]
MRLDDLAREATASLVTDTTPDTVTGLADLKRTNRRRASARAVGAGVAVAALVGGWFAITANGPTEPEPAAPVVRNGVLLLGGDKGFHKVDGVGRPLDLPVDRARYSEFSFTADGSEIVYTTNRAVIVAHDVASGAARELWDCPHPSPCFGSVSPDGQQLAVPVDEGIEVHRVDGDGVDLLDTPEPPEPFVAWSPDGGTLAFTGTAGLYTVDADGTDLRNVVTFEGPRASYVRPEWSPDGNSIAYIEDEALEQPDTQGRPVPSEYFLRLVDRDGDSVRTLQALGSCYCIGISPPDLAWAPDGSSIAFTKVIGLRNGDNARADGVHLLDLGTGTTKMLSGGETGNLAWQPLLAAP